MVTEDSKPKIIIAVGYPEVQDLKKQELNKKKHEPPCLVAAFLQFARIAQTVRKNEIQVHVFAVYSNCSEEWLLQDTKDSRETPYKRLTQQSTTLTVHQLGRILNNETKNLILVHPGSESEMLFHGLLPWVTLLKDFPTNQKMQDSKRKWSDFMGKMFKFTVDESEDDRLIVLKTGFSDDSDPVDFTLTGWNSLMNSLKHDAKQISEAG